MTLKTYRFFSVLFGFVLVALFITEPLNAIQNEIVDQNKLRTGKLPNGLTYYIQSNPYPAKRAFLWLSVNAGSIQEDEDQLGFAHLLEHMAFNGTKNFPGNTLIDVIEKAGMNFGADLNAYTSFDETVYQLTIPTDDSLVFSQGMQIIDDWASGRILNDSVSVAGERGVVLGEWRTRLLDSVRTRFQKENLERIYGKGSRYLERIPIGSPDLLKEATPGPLIRYYKDWYRPDNMAIIAVGDFDADLVEKDIIKRFSDLPPVQNPREFIRPTGLKSDTTIVNLIKDKINFHMFEMSWLVPPPSQNIEDMVRRELLEDIFIPHIQRSLTRLSKLERRPFAQALIGKQALADRSSSEKYIIRLVAHPDSVLSGAATILKEIETISQHGLRDVDMEVARASILRRLQQDVDGSSAISSRELAQKYSRHFLTGHGNLVSPAEKLSIAKRILPTIKNTDLSEVASAWKGKRERIVTVYSPTFSPLRFVTESQVNRLLDSIGALSLDKPTSATIASSMATVVSDLKKVAGKPGRIEKRSTIPGSNVNIWNLSNGATVVYKETSSNPDEVIIHAYSVGGHSLLPDTLFYSPGRLVAMLMTAAGGFGDMKRDDLLKQASLTGLREFNVSINAFDEEVHVSGSPRELELMFQMIHHQFYDPSVDTNALNEWRRSGFNTLSASKNDQIIARLGISNRRLSLPQPVNVPFVDINQAMRVYKDRFGDASDFTFYIVGAADDQKKVESLVERYIANLPSNPTSTPEKPSDFNIFPPVGVGASVNNYGSFAERANLELNFFSSIPADLLPDGDIISERNKLSVLTYILNRRLRNKLREEMAVTYGVGSGITYYQIPDPRMVLSLTLVTDPSMIDTSSKVIWEEIERIKRLGPTSEELEIAKVSFDRKLENSMNQNTWWVEQFKSAQFLGLPIERIVTPVVPLFNSQEIAATATVYLDKMLFSQRIVKPSKKVMKEAAEAREKKDKP